MAIRIDADDVKQIYGTDLRTSEIDACIEAASPLVDTIVTTSVTPTITAAELRNIEKYLAAHFVWLRDPKTLREVVGESEAWHYPASVTTSWRQGLGLSPYGQMATALDRSGTLAKLGLKQAVFRVAPRENSSEFTEHLRTDNANTD